MRLREIIPYCLIDLRIYTFLKELKKTKSQDSICPKIIKICSIPRCLEQNLLCPKKLYTSVWESVYMYMYM